MVVIAALCASPFLFPISYFLRVQSRIKQSRQPGVKQALGVIEQQGIKHAADDHGQHQSARKLTFEW